MSLIEAKLETKHIIKAIDTDDEELNDFLFTLGCFSGEEITVVSVMGNNYTVSIRDARYSINKDLAAAIIIE